MITDRVQVLSGEPHREVDRPDGASFFLDPVFIYALENINHPELRQRLSRLFNVTQEEADAVLDTIVKTRLVIQDEGSEEDGLESEASPKPRVGILTERMKLGFGVDLVVHETASRLTRRGYDVVVFTGSVDPIYASVEYKIVQLTDSGRLADVFSQDFFKHAMRSLKDADRDVWILESLPFYYWRDSLAGPVIFVEHGTPDASLFPSPTSLAVRMARLTKRERVFRVLRPTDRIVAISKFIASELPKEAADRTVIIRNGCDHYPLVPEEKARRFREELGAAPSDVLAAYVGRIDLDKDKQPYKSVDKLIALCSRVREEQPGLRLLLAGRSDALTGSQLKEMGVIPLLNAPADRIALALAAADVFVTMSLWEGFDLPLCEAQFQGTPCVAMRCGAHPELIDGTGAGVLAANEAEFETAIRELSRAPEALLEMSRKARENSRRFLWDVNVDRMSDLIEGVFARRNIYQHVRPNPPGRMRFGLAAASEVLRHEGIGQFVRLAVSKLGRMWGRN